MFTTKQEAIMRMNSQVKKLGIETRIVVFDPSFSIIASNGRMSSGIEREMKSWFYMQKKYPKRVQFEKLALVSKKNKVNTTSTRYQIIRACNDIFERSYHCLNSAPVYVSARNDCFCLKFFLFRGRVGRWIISTRKSDMLRDAGWVKSSDMKKDPTLVSKWEVYDGSHWERSPGARAIEVSKRASWRPDLDVKRAVSPAVRRAARRSSYKINGKRDFKNLCVFSIFFSLTYTHTRTHIHTHRYPADFVLKRIQDTRMSSFGFVVTKDLVVIAVTSEEAQDSGLMASAQITHVNGAPVETIKDLVRETKDDGNNDTPYTFRALTFNRVVYTNRQPRNLWSEVKQPSEMIKWKFHVSLLNSRCHGHGQKKKDTGHRIYRLFDVIPLYHPDYISDAKLTSKICSDTEIILGQLPSVHVLRLLQRRRGLTSVLSAVEPFELAYIRDETLMERNELEKSFATWQKNFETSMNQKRSYMKDHMYEPTNVRGVTAAHLSNLGSKLTGSSDTRLIDMLKPTNVTYGSLREFKLHLTNDEVEGPLKHILCEMKDFARAEYKLLCFGAFFAIDHLLRGRQIENMAMIVARLGEKYKWKAPETCHNILSFLWKDTQPLKDNKEKDVMYVENDLDFVVTAPGAGGNFNLPSLTRKAPLKSRPMILRLSDSSSSSHSLSSTFTSMFSGGTAESVSTDGDVVLTPDIINDLQQDFKSSTSSAKIAAKFAALTLMREECLEYDHRVSSVFCHCKAGKGRGATITAAVILSVGYLVEICLLTYSLID